MVICAQNAGKCTILHVDFKKIPGVTPPAPLKAARIAYLRATRHFEPLALNLYFTNYYIHPYFYQLPTFEHLFISYQFGTPPLTAPLAILHRYKIYMFYYCFELF